MYLRFLEMLQDSDLDPSRTCSEQRPETREAVQMEPRITSTIKGPCHEIHVVLVEPIKNYHSIGLPVS